jgi:hypothetical protein
MNTEWHGYTTGGNDANNQGRILRTCGIEKSNTLFLE